ncbi:hypothetical protein B6E66_02610 [Streptomyces maremycinicus]|nr:hypothetical protein B6E66_02610 [Streptomyces sp. B9173]
MTSPRTGRFYSSERTSDVSDLSDNFRQLLVLGRGYLEVRWPDRELPQLTLSFRGRHAVVHLFNDAETVSLLAGDGTVPSEVTIDVPIMDDLAEFTGDFVLGVERAWNLVRECIRNGKLGDPGQWCEL